jgi:pimeloyl-ACP methyl ester carboxylesterase
LIKVFLDAVFYPKVSESFPASLSDFKRHQCPNSTGIGVRFAPFFAVIDPMGIKVEDSFVDKLGRKKLEEMYLNVCTVEKMKNMMEIGFSQPPYVPTFILEYLTQEKCKVSKLDAHKYKGLYDNNLNLLNDMTEKSKKINVPTLILWGKEDKILSVKNAYALNKYIKNSKLIIFDNLGHMPMLENSELTANSIIEFLRNTK